MPNITVDGKDYDVSQEVVDAYRKKSESANDLITTKRKLIDMEEKYDSLKQRSGGEDTKELRRARVLLEKIPDAYRSEEGIGKLLRAREHADDYDVLQIDFNKLDTRYTKLKESTPSDFNKERWEGFVSGEKSAVHRKTITGHIEALNVEAKEKSGIVPEFADVFMDKAWVELGRLDTSDEKKTREEVKKILYSTMDEQIAYNEKVLGEKGRTTPHPGLSGNAEGEEGKVSSEGLKVAKF